MQLLSTYACLPAQTLSLCEACLACQGFPTEQCYAVWTGHLAVAKLMAPKYLYHPLFAYELQYLGAAIHDSLHGY